MTPHGEHELLPLVAGMVMREDGTLRWPVVLGGVITTGSVAVAGWLVSTSANIAAIEARQQIVLQRLDRLESSTHPATTKRFTADDADRMEARLIARMDHLETRIDNLERRR